MTSGTEAPAPQNQVVSSWTSSRAYLLALAVLLLGTAVGYFLRGSGALAPAAHTTGELPSAGREQQNVTPEMLRHMADKQAEPLLAELQTSPQDPELLTKLGNIYYETRNFKEAIEFYRRAVASRDSTSVRADLGSAYWYSGDADSAIREFESALKLDPNNADAYFNLGMVKWQGKMDVDGAIAAWEMLLRKHPNHPNRRQVETMIAHAKQHAGMPIGSGTAKADAVDGSRGTADDRHEQRDTN
jgi:cytochrome c-type biogenesis protein CcmH/NrfG